MKDTPDLGQEFIKHVIQDFEENFRRLKLPNNREGFLIFLVSRRIIPKVELERYTILKVFYELLPDQEYHKGKTIRVVKEKYGIQKTDRTIWTILTDHVRRFK